MPVEMCNIPDLIDINKVGGTGRIAIAYAPDALMHMRKFVSVFTSIKGQNQARSGQNIIGFSVCVKADFCACCSCVYER